MRIWNKRRSKKELKILLLVILMVSFLSIGWSSLVTTMTLSGTTTIKGNTWDVHFENIVVSDSSTVKTVPSIDNRTSISYSIILEKPGNYYEFFVDVVNKGTIDAMVSTANLLGLSDDYKNLIDYTFTYSDGSEIKKYDALGVGKKKTVRVYVKYREDISDDLLPDVDINLDLSMDLSYCQADDNAIFSVFYSLDDKNSNGKADVGEIISASTERFYVISNNNGEVRALAEWNLMVGNQVDSNYDVVPIANPTGLQDSSAIGYDEYIFPNLGTVAFSNVNYWNDNDGDVIDLNNKDNLINEYLINYKKKLKAFGLEIKDVTLISKMELEVLGCSASDFSCVGAPSWVYQTSYWTKSILSAYSIWDVFNNGDFSRDPYYTNDYVGVRPVIVIDESEIGQ